MKYKILLLVLMFSASAYALNSKQITSMKLKIRESGTLSPSGEILSPTLKSYIPQNYQRVEASADWNIITDDKGNKMIELSWDKLTKKTPYYIDIYLNSKATYSKSGKIVPDNKWVNETKDIRFPDWIREKTFYYNHSLYSAIDLTLFTNQFLTYDKSLTGKSLSVKDILEKRKGVCVEHTTLLTSLLRSLQIPTKYIAGYAYSKKDNKFIGHTWVEIYTENGWFPLDPTWLEAGYLDATHIKTAELMGNKQTSTISYLGNGEVDWDMKPVSVDILNYSTARLNNISLSTEESYSYSGYVKASISGSCSFLDLRINSCVDKEKNEFLTIHHPNRKIFLCNKKDVYWFFTSKKGHYICPVNIYDQSGNHVQKEISINTKTQPSQPPAITGPSTSEPYKPLTLTASNTHNSSYIFYSPQLGNHEQKAWTLKLKPGLYDFYLYSHGQLARKQINITPQKSFQLGVDNPENTTLNHPFTANISIENLKNITQTALLTINFNKKTKERIVLLPEQKKELHYNLTPGHPGNRKILVTVYNNTLTSYTSTIYVYEKQTIQEKILHSIKSTILDFINKLLTVLSSYF